MGRIDKTVFISYRRVNVPWALAIYQHLTHHGYDVFFDYQGIASGDFERVILENIKARGHFLVLLTPSALERAGDKDDWLRREIETALATRRNIVPLMLENFDFDARSIKEHLTGSLADLRRYNALRIPADFFNAAMNRLCEKYLDVPLDAVLHPVHATVRDAVIAQQASANAATPVVERQLMAQEWYEKSFQAVDEDERAHCLSRAIAIDPRFAEALLRNGYVLEEIGDLETALRNYSGAIELNPNFALAYDARGLLRYRREDFKGAIADYAEALRLKPDDADFNAHLADALRKDGDVNGAIDCYSKAIRLRPEFDEAYFYRGSVRAASGDRTGGMDDFTEAIRLNPDSFGALYRRALLRICAEDLEGASSDLTKAIELKGDYAAAYYHRGVNRFVQLDHAGALSDLEKYLELGDQEHDPAEVRVLIEAIRAKS